MQMTKTALEGQYLSFYWFAIPTLPYPVAKWQKVLCDNIANGTIDICPSFYDIGKLLCFPLFFVGGGGHSLKCQPFKYQNSLHLQYCQNDK